MALTRREMQQWLQNTKAPRSIHISFSFPDAVLYGVGCEVASIRDCQVPNCDACNPEVSRRHGKTLAETRTFPKAQALVEKYQRWLTVFEAAESARGE